MDISSKFSLYDIVAMIVPGGIILATFLLLVNYDVYPPMVVMEVENSSCLWLVLIILSYLTGLINNSIADKVFSRFRNNRVMILNEFFKVVQRNTIIHLSDYIKIRRCFYKIKPLRFIPSISIIWCTRTNYNVLEYYKAYYFLAKNKLLGNIPYIEAQIILIRNSLIPIILMAIALYIKNLVVYAVLIIILVPALYIVMILRQGKVYQMIWESVNYYSNS